jgi:hypothetical protein
MGQAGQLPGEQAGSIVDIIVSGRRFIACQDPAIRDVPW